MSDLPLCTRWEPSEFNPEGHNFIRLRGPFFAPWRAKRACVACYLTLVTTRSGDEKIWWIGDARPAHSGRRPEGS